MGRVEKRSVKRRRDRETLLRRVLLFLSALVVLAGVTQRFTGGEAIRISAVPSPTATPVAAAFDETVEQRELTLEAETWYALQTGVYTDRAKAEQRAEAYRDRGAPGLVVKEGEKYRVFIASYGDAADASSVRESLADKQNVETYQYAWVCPAVTLRLSGMAGQLDVAAAGLTLPGQAAARLRDGALAMDAGQMTMSEASALFAEIDEQMRLWASTARKRFIQPYPALVETELSLTDSWSATWNALKKSSAESATALSAEMKTQAMRLYAQSIALRASLQDE